MRIPALVQNPLVLLGLSVAVATQACYSTRLECTSNADCPGSVCGNGRCLLPDARPDNGSRLSAVDAGPDQGSADKPEPAPDVADPADADADAAEDARDAVANQHADSRDADEDKGDALADLPSDAAVDGAGDAAANPVESGDLTSLELLSQTRSLGGMPMRVVKHDRYIVLGDWHLTVDSSSDGSIQIYDVADPSGPTLVSSLATAGEEVHDLALYGDRLYVANDVWGLRVVDISIPTRPASLGTRSDGTYAHSIAIVPPTDGEPVVLLGYLFVGGVQAYGMAQASVLRPFLYEPSLVTPHATATHIEQLGVAGEFAYAWVSDGLSQACLEILHASQPSLAQPRKLCLPFVQNGVPGDSRVQGRFLYLATSFAALDAGNNPGGLRIIDLVDPANPTVVGGLDLPPSPSRIPWRGTGLATDGAHVFLVGHTGVHIIDVSVPSSPRLLRTQPFPASLGECQGGFALLDGNMLYVGAYCAPPEGHGGLLVYRRTPSVDGTSR